MKNKFDFIFWEILGRRGLTTRIKNGRTITFLITFRNATILKNLQFLLQ